MEEVNVCAALSVLLPCAPYQTPRNPALHRARCQHRSTVPKPPAPLTTTKGSVEYRYLSIWGEQRKGKEARAGEDQVLHDERRVLQWQVPLAASPSLTTCWPPSRSYNVTKSRLTKAPPRTLTVHHPAFSGGSLAELTAAYSAFSRRTMLLFRNMTMSDASLFGRSICIPFWASAFATRPITRTRAPNPPWAGLPPRPTASPCPGWPWR